MEMKLILILCIFFASAVAEEKLAPFITPCHKKDLQCIRRSAQEALPVIAAGLPRLGVRPLDPLTLDRVKAEQAGLKFEFRNTTVRGLRKCQVLSLTRHGNRENVELDCSPTLIGQYKMDGKLLILKVEGQGMYKIRIRNIVVQVNYDVGEKSRSGHRYWTVDNWKFSYDVKTGAEFNFDDLFNGQSELANPVLEFANAHWHDIIMEVAPPVVKAIVAKIVDEVRKFFDNVPIDQLSLD